MQSTTQELSLGRTTGFFSSASIPFLSIFRWISDWICDWVKDWRSSDDSESRSDSAKIVGDIGTVQAVSFSIVSVSVVSVESKFEFNGLLVAEGVLGVVGVVDVILLRHAWSGTS